MPDGLVDRVQGFIERLTPGALRGVDLACDFLLPALVEIGDPRSLAIVEALQVGCKIRASRRRRRRRR